MTEPPITIKCLNCKKEFVAETKEEITAFCSEKCQNEYKKVTEEREGSSRDKVGHLKREGEELSPSGKRIEIPAKKRPQKPELEHVKIHPYNKCPYPDCQNEVIYYDPKEKIYYCSKCERAWQ